jgi:hypothetical protein
MRDFSVAMTTILPLLLLTMAIETRLGLPKAVSLAKRTQEFVDEVVRDIDDYVNRYAAKFRTFLGFGVLVECSVLAVVPFMPDGRPEEWFHWAMIIVGVTTVLAYASMVIGVLALSYRNEGKEAIRGWLRDHGHDV